MALDIRLSSASWLADLGAGSAYGIRESVGSLGWPNTQRVYAEPWQRGFHPLVGVSYGNREMELTLKLTDTSLDNWITSYRNVERMLLETQRYWQSGGVHGEKAVLSVQLNGMTNATEWDVIAGDLPAGDLFRHLMTRTTAPMLPEVPLRLTCKPFGRPQTLTESASGSIANGRGTADGSGSYTLSAPAGDVEAPLRVAIMLASGVDARRIMLARRTRGNVATFKSALHCESTVESGYTVAHATSGGTWTVTNTAVAAAESGEVARIVRASNGAGGATITWTLNVDVADWFGTYAVYLRIDALSGAEATGISFQHKWGGATGTDRSNAAVTPAATITDGLVYLGRMTIPHRASLLDATLASFLFTVEFTSAVTSGGFTIDADSLHLFPIDEQVLDIELSANSGTQDQLVSDGLAVAPVVSLLDSAGDLQPEKLSPKVLQALTAVPGVDNLWIPLVFESASTSFGPAGHNLADTLTLNFRYHPLSALAR